MVTRFDKGIIGIHISPVLFDFISILIFHEVKTRVCLSFLSFVKRIIYNFDCSTKLQCASASCSVEWLNSVDLLSILVLDELGEEQGESCSSQSPVNWVGLEGWDQVGAPGSPEWRFNSISSESLPGEIGSQVGQRSTELVPTGEHTVDVVEGLIPSARLVLLDQKH